LLGAFDEHGDRVKRDIADLVPPRGHDGVAATKSKRELYEEAREAGIEGRSAMNKEQLVEALREHRAPRAPAPADAPGPERCDIVYKESGGHGAFQVVVTERDGSRRAVAHSAGFRAPRFGRLRRRGPARVAHELLVSRLEACEWWSVDAGGPWYELQFVRLRSEGMRSRRSLVTVVREAGKARFAAEELDSYGKPTPLALSVPFRAPRFLRVRPSTRAKAALKQLILRMEAKGWKAAAAGTSDWYAISLLRPVGGNRRSLASRSELGRF
jgi:Rho termination factor, N-terminal domain